MLLCYVINLQQFLFQKLHAEGLLKIFSYTASLVIRIDMQFKDAKNFGYSLISIHACTSIHVHLHVYVLYVTQDISSIQLISPPHSFDHG